MRADYWEVDNQLVIEKTGNPLAHWMLVLDNFKSAEKKSNDIVAHLQNEHNAPRYWARTLTTRYLKQKQD